MGVHPGVVCVGVDLVGRNSDDVSEVINGGRCELTCKSVDGVNRDQTGGCYDVWCYWLEWYHWCHWHTADAGNGDGADWDVGGGRVGGGRNVGGDVGRDDMGRDVRGHVGGHVGAWYVNVRILVHWVRGRDNCLWVSGDCVGSMVDRNSSMVDRDSCRVRHVMRQRVMNRHLRVRI